MTVVRRGFDVFISIVGVASWGFLAFVLGAHFVSRPAGGLFALAIVLSACAIELSTYLEESRMQRLVAGVCPSCRGAVNTEHRHRRWAPERDAWLPPETSWQCSSCGYSHSERWVCAACPTPV